MPASSNSLYACFNGRLIKSKQARGYDQAINLIKIKNHRKTKEFMSNFKKGNVICVDVFCVFPESV